MSSAMQLDMSVVRDAKAGRVCMVIEGVAYDFTEFLDDHPGGSAYLARNKGKVATEEFIASHPVEIIKRTLTREQFGKMKLGQVDPSSIRATDLAAPLPSAAASGQSPDQPSHIAHRTSNGVAMYFVLFCVVAPYFFICCAISAYAPGLVVSLKDNRLALVSDTAAPVAVAGGKHPELGSCINLFDFEAIASRKYKEGGTHFKEAGCEFSAPRVLVFASPFCLCLTGVSFILVLELDT